MSFILRVRRTLMRHADGRVGLAGRYARIVVDAGSLAVDLPVRSGRNGRERA